MNKIYSAILLLTFISSAQTPNPINLFSPQVGQTEMLINMSHDSSWIDSTIYTVVGISGNGALIAYNGNQESSTSWQNGILSGPPLLTSGMLDTNGIFDKQMVFPKDYSGEAMERKYGYVLNHDIQGINFDTLLVSCVYMSFIDAGDMCDFITTSGYLVNSVNNNCFCVGGGHSRNLEDEDLVYISAGSTPVIKIILSVGTIPSGNTSYYNIKGIKIWDSKPTATPQDAIKRSHEIVISLPQDNITIKD